MGCARFSARIRSRAETRALSIVGGGATQPDQHVCSICSVVRARDCFAGAGGELKFYPPVVFRRAPAARKSASDDRFTAGARLR